MNVPKIEIIAAATKAEVVKIQFTVVVAIVKKDL